MKHEGELPKAPHADCLNCTLINRPFVPTYAPEDAKIAVVGEGPAYNEVHEGKPFVGQSGKLLQIALERQGLDYEKVWRTNAVLCWPRNNRKPTDNEIKCCSQRLNHDLDEFTENGGEGILTVGQSGREAVLPSTRNSKISKVRGHWFERKGITVMPTWHPAYVLRRPSAAKNFFGDARRIVHGNADHPLRYEPDAIFIDTEEELADILAEIPEGATVAYDLETDQVMWYPRPGEPADAILMLGLAWDRHFGVIIHPDLMYDSPFGADALNEFFARTDLTFVAHNGKFDMLFLRSIGIEARTDFDTMLAHYACWEIAGTHGLKQLALEYYGLPDYEEDLVQKHLRSRNDYYSKVPYEDLGLYCVWDVVVTRELCFDLEEEMIREGVYDEPFKSLLMPLQQALMEMEWRGLPVDREHVIKWQENLLNYTEDIADEMGVLADDPALNPRSPKQVSHVMYEVLQLPRPMQANVNPNSTSKTALVHIPDGKSPFVDLLRKYRRAHKMNRSYLKNLLLYADVNDRVHPSALVHGTEVGRLSFRNPAIQTIPRPYEDMFGAMIRSAFVAPEGWKFIIADYSQAELRVAAVLSGEKFLLDAYREGRDLHTEVAIAMYGHGYTPENRAHCKMFNFSYLYGGSERSFALDAGLPLATARRFVRDYNEVMPDLAKYKRAQFKKARTQGYVTSFFGRKRRFPLITKRNKSDVRKASVHFPISSAASDLTMLSLLEAEERGHLLVLTVHDSNGELALTDDAEERAAELRQIMIDTGDKHFPEIPWEVDVDIRDRWSPLPEEIHHEQVTEAFG